MGEIVFYKPTIKRKDMDAVLQTMVDEKIGPGQKRNELKQELNKLLGCDNALLLRTYKDAIKVALKLANVENSKVAISAFADKTYLEAIKESALEASIVDIDVADCIIDINKIPSDARVVVINDTYSTLPLSKDFKALGLSAIEDVSQSIGCMYQEQKAGSFADIIVGTMEENNLISTAGGAFVAVRGKQLASALNGFDNPLLALPDLNCALGLMQIVNFEQRIEKRREIYKLYKQSSLKTVHKVFGLNSIDLETNGDSFALMLDSKPSDAIKFAQKYDVPIKMAFTNTIGNSMIDDFDHIPLTIPFILRTVIFPIYPFLTQREVENIARIISHLG